MTTDNSTIHASTSQLTRDEALELLADMFKAAEEDKATLREALSDLTRWADAVIGEPDKAMGEQTFGNSAIKAALYAIKDTAP